MIDFDLLDELRRWMIDNSVVEVEVNGVRMKLAENAIPLEQPDIDDEDGPEPARAPATFESLRAGAIKRDG
jgi:hypothetical protein